MSQEARTAGDELSARVGELRRLTFMYCDVVGSTELSGRQEPEAYRELMRGYRTACREVIETRFEGHILHVKGDGALSVFGFPVAHENDAERAVRAGLALVHAVHELSATSPEPLDVRVAVHHGPVYLDIDEDDIYGLAANVGARLQTLADPGTVVVSEEVGRLVGGRFELEAGEPQSVKGVAEPLVPLRVVQERKAAAQRSASTPLVEREEELERLRAAWARARAATADHPIGVLVRGEAGLGKTRLVAALHEEVCSGEGCFVELHGSPFHVDAGFHPIRSLIEARSGIRDDSGASERLARLVDEVTSAGLDPDGTIPFLAPVLGIDPAAGYVQAATQGRKLEEQVSETVLSYVLGCTGGGAAVLVAENMHWFDVSTRDLLEELMRVGPGNLLVVVTSRTAEPGSWETIELRPLTLSGRLELIDALQEGVSKEDRLVLATRSDGVPLYLEELVRAGPAPEPGAGVAPAPGSVPAALYEPLVARLYATPAALPVAATVAAAGHQADRALLAGTMSLPTEELDSTLRDLVEAQVLQVVGGRSPRYRFRHELLREVAYELQPPSWRRKVHGRLCDVFNRDEPSDWRVLASHCECAERYHEAAVAYEHTAEWARRRGALEEARSHLARAIELVEQLPADSARDHLDIELRLRRGFIAMSSEGAASPQASADFDRCLELAGPEPQSDDMFSTLISVWAYYLSRGELARTRQVSETLRAGLDRGRDYFRPQNLAGFGMLDWFAGDFRSALDTLTAATDQLAAMGREDEVEAVWFVPNDPTTAMHAHLGLARFMAGDASGADASVAQARAAAAECDFPQAPWSDCYATWLGSWMWLEAGRLEIARRAMADLDATSARHGFDTWELISATHSATLDAVAAMDAGAADIADRADALDAYLELWQGLGLRVFLPYYLTVAGRARAASGQVEEARRRYQESLQLAEETGMRFYDAETARCLALLAGDQDDRIAELQAALELARAQRARPFESRIALDLRLVGEEIAQR